MYLSRLYRKTFRKPLSVYWWRYEYPSKLNFGDELTPLLINRIFNLPTQWAEPSQCDLIGAGSIIEAAGELSKGHRIRVWGSGFIKDGEPNQWDNLEFFAVRGTSTRRRVGSGDIALGDPGILSSLAFPEINSKTKRHKIGLVAHYADADSPLVREIEETPGAIIINPLWPVERVFRTIASCDIILSSSLHGLIVADSFSVPNYWTPLSNKLTGGNYKFNDYYSAFGGTANPLQVKSVTSLDVDSLISHYRPPSNLDQVQKSLIQAFPY